MYAMEAFKTNIFTKAIKAAFSLQNPHTNIKKNMLKYHTNSEPSVNVGYEHLRKLLNGAHHQAFSLSGTTAAASLIMRHAQSVAHLMSYRGGQGERVLMVVLKNRQECV